jgi:glutamate transport system permease protein
VSGNPVLYDHPGPRAKVRNAILTVVFGAAILALLWWIYRMFDEKGQFAGVLWEPFTQGATWTNFIFPGIEGTLKAAATAMVLALAFGLIFSVGRLSEHRWISIPAGVVVEFFRAVPLLLMIFFISFGVPFLIDRPVAPFWSVVIGLTLYNGSVLAEAFRAGIRAVPAGQSEAAYAIGMRKSGVMRHILVPQAARSMLPVIVSQLVVLLKDTALGYIVSYPELLQLGVNVESANYGNVVAAAIVVAALYIVVNFALSGLANYLDRRSQRRGIRAARVGQGATMGNEGAGMPGCGLAGGPHLAIRPTRRPTPPGPRRRGFPRTSTGGRRDPRPCTGVRRTRSPWVPSGSGRRWRGRGRGAPGRRRPAPSPSG